MEKKISNEDMGNQPAFGAVAYDALGGGYCQEGLTKREYFAAMALQGLVSQQAPVDRILNEGNQSLTKQLAAASVVLADALITTLNTNQ